MRTILIVVVGILLSVESMAQEASGIDGAWTVRSIEWILADKTHEINPAQPGQFLFADGGYSVMWTSTREPRVAFENLSDPTDEEAIAAFGSIVFNGGSYQLVDDKLTLHPMIARVPGFEGGEQVFTVEHKGDRLMLVMVDETYPDGTKPDWYGKMKTRFVLEPS